MFAGSEVDIVLIAEGNRSAGHMQRSKLRGPEDLVFADKADKPLDTHNMLQRHLFCAPAREVSGAGRTKR